jgi:predicted transcriptional regulator
MQYDDIRRTLRPLVIGMTTEAITIRTDRRTVERLDRLAKALDRSRNYIVRQALEAYLEEQSWQVQAIEDGLASLDRGAGRAHEQVMAEMRAKIRRHGPKDQD